MDYINYNLDKLAVADLEELINFHNQQYWEKGAPLISDSDYDLLLRKLKSIAPDHQLINEIHTPIVTSNGKVRHNEALLSLDKAYSLEEVLEWAKKHARSDNEEFLIEPKYDGISANYTNGILATRGNGIEGEDISDKSPLIELETINYRGILNSNVRGEIIMRPDHFRRFNEHWGTPYKNSRNVLTGLMTLKKSNDIAKVKYVMDKYDAKLSLIDYDLISISVNLVDFAEEWEKILPEFENLPYPLDGIVIKLADKEYRKSLGNTAHHPRGEIAFKFQNSQAKSKLIDVKWSFGKNCLTPVAEIEPVELNGITIRHATLHNYENLITKDIQIGDEIIIERAGDVIPYIKESIAGENRVSPIITECPSCHSKLEKIGPELACLNKDCFETNLQKLLAATNSMGIEGLGEPTLRQMMLILKVKNLKDIFNLHESDFNKLEGFKAKASANLYNNIQNAKNIKDYQLLAALNIAHIGINMAKLLLKENTLKELSQMDEEQLNQIHGIGPERAKALYNDLKQEKTFISELLEALSVFETKGGATLKSVCFTGKMINPRSYYEKIAKQNHYEVQDSVNGNLSILVCANATEKSSKIQKALKLGIQIIEVDDWLKSLNIDISKDESPVQGFLF